MKKSFLATLAFGLVMGIAISASAISLGDVTLDTKDANGYVGPIGGNIDNNANYPGVFNEWNWIVNSSTTITASGDEFYQIAKFDYDGTSTEVENGSLDIFEFSLSYIGDSTSGYDPLASGTWILNWTTPETTIPNDDYLSYTLDFVVGIKPGDFHAFYLFQDYVIDKSPDSANGTYLTFNLKDISHMTIYARITEKTAVPEPGAYSTTSGQ